MKRGFALVAAALVFLCEPSITNSCGPDIHEAVFVSYEQPDLPLESFAAGSLGVLQPSWRQRFLVVAYRRLQGLPLEPSLAMRALLPGSRDSAATPPWAERWRKARAAVGEVQAPRAVWTENTMQVENDYIFYQGCLDDAFRTAITTLEDRARRSAGDRAPLLDWVRAQDQVFANCRGASALPDAAPAGAPAWLKKDRAYQNAAALFYANRFDEARAAFEAIARDAASPWSAIAPYMVARSLTRKGTLTAGWREVDAASLEEAQRVVKRVLADPRRKELHPAARRLESFLRFRLHRAERMGELSKALVAQRPDAEFASQVHDLTLLFDHFSAAQVESLAATSPDYELADWVRNFQAGTASHAMDRWRKTRSTAWLVAAIARARGREAGAEELMQAASKVPLRNPAFATVSYHRARLLQEVGRADQARTLLDELLQGEARSWPRSAQNLLHARRLRLAQDPAEFLTHAQRVPAAMGTPSQGMWELEAEDRGRPLLDQDAVWIFNHGVPIDELAGMVVRPEVSNALRPRLALTAWTRAVLLDRHDVATPMASIAAAGFPDLRGGLNGYASERDLPSRRFAATWVMLHAPGVNPWLRPGVGRPTPPSERNILHDNWWCQAAEDRSAYPPSSEYARSAIEAELYQAGWNRPPTTAIVLPAHRDGRAAAVERARLDSIGPAPDYLCRQTLAWADRNPSDPRLPEALALAVRSTRYGCSNKSTSAWSRRAFDRLHRRFPKSEWTRRTPYWY